MISLDVDATILVIGFVALLAVAWGANLSVRSAAAGPAWAMQHLSAARRVWPGLLGLGLVVSFVVRPLWVGLAVLYIVATMWFLSAALLRNLHRLEALDGFADIGAERRSAVLRRSRRFLFGGGGLLALIGAVTIAAGPVAWVTIAMGAVLIGTGAMLTTTADGGI